MDPITIGLGAKVIDVLIPYVKKEATVLAKEVGVPVVEQLEGILKTLKTKLKGDSTAMDMLDEFEKDPETYKPALEKILQKKVEQDKNLAIELDKQLKEIPDLVFITKVGDVKQRGKVVTLEADEITGGKIKATTTAEQIEGELVTAKIGYIGVPPRGAMNCIKCDAPLDPDARFCNRCGMPISKKSPH